MATKYSQISPVGQINDMACWAACLKWWYKAAMSITPSQTKLWERYKHLRDSLGGMTVSGIEHIVRENAMTFIAFPNAASFTPQKVQALLASGPIYTAYTETGRNIQRHVNVIYGITSSDPWAEVLVMEPQAKPSGEGWYYGKHKRRSLSEFNLSESVYVGVHRENFRAWQDCFGSL
jgi:hypothetical protein